MSASRFCETRLIEIDWTDGYVTLSIELAYFNLRNLERSSLYVMPRHPLNSAVWSEFEAVMNGLQHGGKCSGWRIVNLN